MRSFLKEHGLDEGAAEAFTTFRPQSMTPEPNQIRYFDKGKPITLEVPPEVKVMASITLPSVLLWWANHDDPRWAEIPRWQKDLFWIVMTDEHAYRIPKLFEIGVLFGSVPERALEWLNENDPKAFADLGGTLGEAFTPGLLPNFAVRVVEQFANRSTFTGAPIIPFANEGLLPELQYSAHTTELGKALGRLVGYVPGMADSKVASPAVLENYIRA